MLAFERACARSRLKPLTTMGDKRAVHQRVHWAERVLTADHVLFSCNGTCSICGERVLMKFAGGRLVISDSGKDDAGDAVEL